MYNYIHGYREERGTGMPMSEKLLFRLSSSAANIV